MECEMCGTTASLKTAKVEGSIMKVCMNCARFGSVLEERRQATRSQRVEEAIPVIVSNYGALVKRAREKKGLMQDELAKRIKEKASVLSHVESGKNEPSIALAKKLERELGITLIEEDAPKVNAPKSSGTEGLTIGDMLKAHI